MIYPKLEIGNVIFLITYFQIGPSKKNFSNAKFCFVVDASIKWEIRSLTLRITLSMSIGNVISLRF
ncbi:hypothetical protein KFK09_006827 [Dendrobium nobile]|uniref:Uncharacterized protein n=1 Tax=Dendrobium nobile TaxID=94219 RepID=A0A8T3BUN9_DENNO|nr:hypothetical protein KFK09_006827 [Dendrobium nobile]